MRQLLCHCFKAAKSQPYIALLWFLVVPTTSHFYGPPAVTFKFCWTMLVLYLWLFMWFSNMFIWFLDLSVYLSQVELIDRWIQMDKDGLPCRRLPGPWQFGPGASCARAAGCVAGLYCAATPRETAYARGRHVGKWMENAWRCWRWKMLSSKHSECADHSVKLWLFDSVSCESPRWWEVAGLWQLLAASGLAFRWWTSTSLALHHGIATWSAQFSDVCSGDKSCSYLKHVS